MTTLFTALITDLVAAAIDVAGPLAAATVGLFVNSPSLDDDTLVEADFTEPGFGGYAQATPGSWIAGVGDSGDLLAKPVTPITITASDAVSMPQICNGWFVLNAGGDVLAAGYFASPIAMYLSGQAITFDPVVPIGRSQQETGAGFAL